MGSFVVQMSQYQDEAVNDVRVPSYSAMLDGFELPPNVAIITLQVFFCCGCYPF
jgi:hypothetical protein